MSNFQSASGLLGTVVVAGTTLIGLKLVTDFIGDSVKNTQRSLPKKSGYGKPFKPYPKFDYGYYGKKSSRKGKKQDIFTIKF